jgi:two-component system chemotaxis response regulator CheY
MRNNLRQILSQGGHQVVGEAGDGVDALLQYIKLKPDIVTMDITMPKEDGIAALKKIMAQDADAKVIMVTANGKREKVLDALNNGALNYITKPFSKQNVLGAVNEII